MLDISMKVVFYIKDNNRAPAEEYLKNLKNKRYLAKMVALVDKLCEEDGKLPKPYAKNVGNKIWELRAHFGGRIFYFSNIGTKIVLLDGITKKTNKIPAKDLHRVKKYYKEYKLNLREKEYDSKLYHKD